MQNIALNVGIGAGAEEILIPEENRLDRLLESLKGVKNQENPQALSLLQRVIRLVKMYLNLQNTLNRICLTMRLEFLY